MDSLLSRHRDATRLPMAGDEAEYEVEFSAIISCYREERTIREFHRRLSGALAGLGRSFEIVYVNDGSRDGTLSILREIYAEDRGVGVLIDLMRNSGSAAAVAAGCAAARGRHFIFLDSDLQLDPEDLPGLIREFDRPVDLVNGVRHERRDTWGRTMASRAFNATLRWFSGSPLLDPFCTFKVARGALVRGLAPGPHRVMNPVHLAAAARDCANVPVAHHGRPHGHSNWTLAGLLALALHTVLGSARHPFQIIALIGLAAAAAALIGTAAAELVEARTLASAIAWMLGLALLALDLCSLYLLGEYLRRVRRAAQGPPRYIVRASWQRDSPSEAEGV